MATLHGKGSVLYMSNGAGSAEQVNETAEWSIDVDFDDDWAYLDNW